MKKGYKLLSVLLAVVLLLGVIPVSALAASYPLVHIFSYEMTPTIVKGDTGYVTLTIFPEYKNEAYTVEVYDSDGYLVASADSTYYNSSSMYRTVKITIDTDDLDMDVGTYKVKYWLDYYTWGDWHTCPNYYTTTIKVINSNCYGNHALYETDIGEDRSCTEKDYSTWKCYNCEYYYEAYTTGDHAYGAWTYYDENNHSKSCKGCGGETTYEKHTWSNFKVTQMPTATQYGSGTYSCAVCGGTKQVDIEPWRNGWNCVGTDWYYYSGGTLLRSVWFQDTKGWVYFGSDAKMVKNNWAKDGNQWYYMGNDGYMVTKAWAKDNTGWLYLGSNGTITKNSWVEYGGKWYFVDGAGYMMSNRWFYLGNKWYYFDGSGAMVTNKWVASGGKWYYFNAQGTMSSNTWVQDGGKWYFVDGSGAMVTNAWKRDTKGWVYLGSNGAMVTNGWAKDSKGWCYLGADGYAVTNCWKQDSYGWIYLDANGSMSKSRWVQDGGYWYYCDANGYMVAGKTIKIGNKAYNFNGRGICTNP